MIQVINGKIKKHGLPKHIVTETGETILNYHLQDEETLKQDGWLPVEENQPEYNTETEELRFERYEILADKVVKHYKVEPIQKSREEVLEQRVEVTENEVANLWYEIATGGAIG